MAIPSKLKHSYRSLKVLLVHGALVEEEDLIEDTGQRPLVHARVLLLPEYLDAHHRVTSDETYIHKHAR